MNQDFIFSTIIFGALTTAGAIVFRYLKDEIKKLQTTLRETEKALADVNAKLLIAKEKEAQLAFMLSDLLTSVRLTSGKDEDNSVEVMANINLLKKQVSNFLKIEAP